MHRWATLVWIVVASCSRTEQTNQEVPPSPSAASSPKEARSDTRRIGEFGLRALRGDALAFLSGQELTFSTNSSSDLPNIRIHATRAMIDQFVADGYFEVTDTPDRDRTRGSIEPGQWCELVPNRLSSNYIWSYDEIREYAQGLAYGSPEIDTINIGTTAENRPIIAVRFGGYSPPYINSNSFPTIYVVATVHAREWGAAGTAVGVMRELAATLANTSRPKLREALKSTAIVVVPVANPDGYEYSRNFNRGQRGNVNFAACPNHGVDLNRNFPSTRGVLSTNTSSICASTYEGPYGGSELETGALMSLLSGAAIQGSDGVFTLDVHNFSDLVVYPSAFKMVSDSDGPACDMRNEYCHSPDFQALRLVFGDTEHHLASTPRFFDEAWTVPFRRGHAANVMYTSTGTVEDEATYGSVRMFAATIETFSGEVGFGIECERDAEVLLEGSSRRLVDTLEELAFVAPVAKPGAAPNNSYWLTSKLGKIATGYVAREYSADTAAPSAAAKHLEARPQFLVPTWTPYSNGRTLRTWFGGQQIDFSRQRRGAFYELFSISAEKATRDPLKLPCSINTNLSQTDTYTLHVTPECLPGGTVDFCDPNRLTATNWTLVDGTRGSARDCWWEPTASVSELLLPNVPAPFASSHCAFTFSMEGGGTSDTVLRVERETAGGTFELLTARREVSPFWISGSTNTVTHVFEANSLLASQRVPAFRITTSGPINVKVFDPVVYCRLGFTE